MSVLLENAAITVTVKTALGHTTALVIVGSTLLTKTTRTAQVSLYNYLQDIITVRYGKFKDSGFLGCIIFTQC